MQTRGVTQLDAAQIHDRLDPGLIPDVVVMNPPFSVAAEVEGRYRDATATHLRSALARLAPGGCLVAVTGEGGRPDRPCTAPAFAALAERGGRPVFSPGLSGRAYTKHGTTVDVNLTVFDRAPAGKAGDPVAPLGVSPNPAALLEAVLMGLPPRLAPALVDCISRASQPPDGVFYPSRLNEGCCIALYDRAVGKLEDIARPRLMACRPELAAILNDLDIACRAANWSRYMFGPAVW